VVKKPKDLKRARGTKMKQLNPFMELEGVAPDFEFEALVLERNKKEMDLLNKKGYKIKPSVWSGLIAS